MNISDIEKIIELEEEVITKLETLKKSETRNSLLNLAYLNLKNSKNCLTNLYNNLCENGEGNIGINLD